MITAENLTRHELIGLDTQISSSTNPEIIGLNGTIIDETKSMLTINTIKGIKKIPKDINNWKFSTDGQDIIIDGKKIAKRSHDRLGARA